MQVSKIPLRHAARIVKAAIINRNPHFLIGKKSMITRTKLIILIIATKTIKGMINLDRVTLIGIIVVSNTKETIIQEAINNQTKKKLITEKMLFSMKRLIQIRINSKEDLLKSGKKSQRIIAIMVTVEKSLNHKVKNRFVQMLRSRFSRLRRVIVSNILRFQ